MTRNKANPFAQSPAYWKISFDLPESAVQMVEDGFDGIALAVSGFEMDEAKKIWTFDLLCGEMPDMTEIQRRLLVLSALHDVETPKPAVIQIQQQDWLKQVARNFPPLSIGRFYVHGSHIEEIPVGAIAIKVDAGAAFGSGEHGTTRGCLEAMEELSNRRQFRNILDMGCGSGILAIGAAKLWRMPVLAADIDPIAVRVTQENVRTNREQNYVTALVSDGYENERIKRTKPFDLIIANILARPLVEFAPALARHLAPGGVAVLSGLLASQEKQVASAHMAQGLKLQKRILHGDWCSLVLKS